MESLLRKPFISTLVLPRQIPVVHFPQATPSHSLSSQPFRRIKTTASKSSSQPRPSTNQKVPRGREGAADAQGDGNGGGRERVSLLELGPGLLDEWTRDWLEREEERKDQSRRDKRKHQGGRRLSDPGAAGAPPRPVESRPGSPTHSPGQLAGGNGGRETQQAGPPTARLRGDGRPLGSAGRSHGRRDHKLGQEGKSEGDSRGRRGGRGVLSAPSPGRQSASMDPHSEAMPLSLSSPNVLYSALAAPLAPASGSPPAPFPSAPAWTERDAAAVARAQRRAEVPQARASSTPSREAGSDVLLGRSLEELEGVVQELGQQKYRGKQLHQFIYRNRGVDLTHLEQLPAELRGVLAEKGFRIGRCPVHHVAAAADGTTKILLLLDDGRVVETVGTPSEGESKGGNSLTACVSSQAGCPLRCSFCATGKGGFSRSLKPPEIVGQVLALEDLFRQKVSSVEFMGMGEPLLNLPSVVRAIKCLIRDLGVAQRNITISTVGVPGTITRLAEHRLQCTLAVSLHAPNQALRQKLVPSAAAYPLHALLKDSVMYSERTGRRVSIDYTLLSGVNDQKEHAAELALLLRRHGPSPHVNVTPYNPVEGAPFRRPSKARVMDFVRELQRHKVQVTVKQSRGMEADAAYGQLWNAFQKQPLEREPEESRATAL